MNPSDVRVERAGNRIFLSSPGPVPGLKYSIPGAYFRQDKIWSLPLDLTVCVLLRERFGKRLVIGSALAAWARAEKATRAAQAETAAASDAELTVLPKVAPLLAEAMDSRRYQRAAVSFVNNSRGRDGRRRALIADTVGLGKTVEALGAVLESEAPGPFLVVCPKTAVDTAWTPEIRRWLPNDEIITVPDSKAERDRILDELWHRTDNLNPGSLARTWVVIHPAAVRTQTWWVCGECGDKTKYRSGIVHTLDCGDDKGKGTKTINESTFPQLFDIAWGAVIADESDQMLIRLTGTPNLQRRGMELLRDLVPEGGVRIAMSGTPFRSKPHQIWSTLNWLDPVRFSSKWSWLQRFWTTGGYSGYQVSEFIEERAHLLVDDLKDIMIRRTREEVRGDLPAKLYPSNAAEGMPAGIWLEMTPKQAKAYKQMEQQGSADVDGGTLNAIGVLAELTRLKQFAGAVGAILPGSRQFVPLAEGNKFDWLIEFLRELGFPDKPPTKLVVASEFTQLLNAFVDGVAAEFKKKIRTGMVTGENPTSRTAVIAEFEDPSSDLSLLFINTKAGGSAITLDAADIMVILDETWVDDEQQQLEGRIDNRNPERRIVPRSYYYLRSLGTVEEMIARGNAEAKMSGKRLLDKDYRAMLEAKK